MPQSMKFLMRKKGFFHKASEKLNPGYLTTANGIPTLTLLTVRISLWSFVFCVLFLFFSKFLFLIFLFSLQLKTYWWHSSISGEFNLSSTYPFFSATQNKKICYLPFLVSLRKKYFQLVPKTAQHQLPWVIFGDLWGMLTVSSRTPSSQ